MYWMNVNIFSISESVIMSEPSFTRLNTELRNRGFIVEDVPYAEIGKMSGLFRCSTMPLIRKLMSQITNSILMISPVSFRGNDQTAVNNYYQKILNNLSSDSIQQKALLEFDNLVDKLERAGVNVIVFKDKKILILLIQFFPQQLGVFP